MPFDDLITTIDSDAEDVVEKPSKQTSSKRKGKSTEATKVVVADEGGLDEKDTLNPDFTFDVTGDIYADVLNGVNGLEDLVKGSKSVSVHASVLRCRYLLLFDLRRHPSLLMISLRGESSVLRIRNESVMLSLRTYRRRKSLMQNGRRTMKNWA